MPPTSQTVRRRTVAPALSFAEWNERDTAPPPRVDRCRAESGKRVSAPTKPRNLLIARSKTGRRDERHASAADPIQDPVSGKRRISCLLDFR